MAEPMIELIHRADMWLAANRPDYYAHLRPGATDSMLDDLEKQFSITLPADFRTVYKWRDGQSGTYESLQDNRMFSPLAEIADTKSMLDDMIGHDFEDPKWWRRGWVPFLDNGGGDHICLDLTAEDGGQPGQLICFWHDWEDRSVEFPSFHAWLEDLVNSMENGSLELT